MKLFARRSSGFTLLELLVVIAVAAILVSIASASYVTAQKKARDSRRMSDMKAIQNAAEQFYADNSSEYPTAGTSTAFNTGGNTYLPSGFPTDPKAAPYQQYQYAASPSGCDNSVTLCAGYTACAQLEDASGGNAGNINGGTGTGFYCVKNLQ